MRKIYLTIGLLFAIATPAIVLAQQCLVMNVPLNNRVDASDIVIEGKIVAETPFLNPSDNLIYTLNTIEVYKILKGEIQTSTVEMITAGGMIEDRWTIVRPYIDMAEGDIGIFFCNNAKSDVPVKLAASVNLTPTASSMAFVKYDLSNLSANDLYSKYNDIQSQLYDRISAQAGVAIRDFHKFSIADVKKEIQSRENAKVQAPAITSFSPTTASAGSKTVLTIKGSGFGSSRGTNFVGFYNADNGGSTWTDVNDNNTTADDLYYPKWTDTEIQIYVPARNSTSGINYFAGTGPICVSVGGTRVQSPGNAGVLTIPWANQEAQSIDGPVPALLGDLNGSGGYTITMNTNFASNTQAATDLLESMEVWSCNDKINWKLGPNSTSTTIADDNVNLIRFSNTGELPTNILGSTTQNLRVYCGSGATRRWYCTGFDMRYNTKIVLGSTTYNMSFGPAPATNSQYDFYTVIVHELGHCHQMGHIIKPNYMMHYAINNGQTTRNLHPELAPGGVYNSNLSMAPATCTITSPVASEMQPYIPASCTTGIMNVNRESNLKIYPVPATNTLNITLNNLSGETLQTIYVYDQLGKAVYMKTMGVRSGITSATVDIENLADGIYFARVISDTNTYSQKIIISR